MGNNMTIKKVLFIKGAENVTLKFNKNHSLVDMYPKYNDVLNQYRGRQINCWKEVKADIQTIVNEA